MATFFALLIAAAVIYFACFRRRAYDSRRSEPVFAKLRGTGRYEFDIVGESKYQDALEFICGGRTDEGAEKRVEALLYMEDQNPYDNQAGRVDVEGKTVGYLARDDARSYRRQITSAVHTQPVGACDVMIVGGWECSKKDRGHFGVKLDLPVL
jgi:hypothetical protein